MGLNLGYLLESLLLYLDQQCDEGEECTASTKCPSILGQILGMNFSGDPEMRDELKEKIDDKICRMANRKESYCCKETDISKTDLSAKFSKSLILNTVRS